MCLSYGKDLDWFRGLTRDDQVRYLADWNLTQAEAKKRQRRNKRGRR